MTTVGAAVDAVGACLGAERVAWDDDTPVVRPRTTTEVAQILAAASDGGWRVGVEGVGQWHRHSAADVIVSTSDLDVTPHIKVADLVVTVGSGAGMAGLDNSLRAAHVWLPVDPPGRERSIGSAVTTGTSGPLELGFGGIRDQVLGMTVVTGDGRILRLGGQVVKNVAGFDITRLIVGGFGAYGVVTELALRTRALPACDTTLSWTAEIEGVDETMVRLYRDRVQPAAFAARVDQSGNTVAAVRFVGADAAVTTQIDRLAGDVGEGAVITPTRQSDAWTDVARTGAKGPTTIRLGFTPSGRATGLDIARTVLPAGAIVVTPNRLRWSGRCTVEELDELRNRATSVDITTVVERGPLVAAVGHYRRVSEPLATVRRRLRDAFDPTGVIVAPLEDPR